MTGFLEGTMMRNLSLFLLRVTLAGLLFWWGLVKGIGTGTGEAVSNKYYAGLFSIDALLLAFGWVQVLASMLIALGLFRMIVLPFQFVVNFFVAAVVWVSLIDPFWLWHTGEKPETVNALFYPSAIVAAASLLVIAFRRDDAWAVDRLIRQ